MVNYELDADKIARGDVKERLRLLYLANPTGVKAMLQRQGVTVNSLGDLETLWDERRAGFNNINFREVLNDMPVTAPQIASLQDRVKFVRSQKMLNVEKQKRLAKLNQVAVGDRESIVIPRVLQDWEGQPQLTREAKKKLLAHWKKNNGKA
jgi:hypothetical protein